MCVIDINLNSTTPNGTDIVSANGRYRKVGEITWNNFTINLSEPKTPNITVIGSYDLQINVTNSLGVTSDWALGSFEITPNCLSVGTGVETITVIDSDDNNCTSCMLIRVDVPPSESRNVNFLKNGLASYAGASVMSCDVGDSTISDNGTITITETTTFRFGLDASAGDGTASSTITCKLLIGTEVIDSVVLSRTHSDPVFNC